MQRLGHAPFQLSSGVVCGVHLRQLGGGEGLDQSQQACYMAPDSGSTACGLESADAHAKSPPCEITVLL